MSTVGNFDRRLTENLSPVREVSTASQPASAVCDGLRYLQEHELPLWDAFVDASPQGSLFARSWWLQAVGGDTRVLASFKNGRIAAGIPLHYEMRYGLKFCRMPKLTPIWGALLPPLKPKTKKTASEEYGVLRELAEALKNDRFFFQFFSSEFNNWLPFLWEGFSQTTRYTYRISVRDIDCARKHMAHNVHQQIRLAERNGIVIVPCDPEQVYALEEQTYLRQGLRVPHTSEYLTRLHSAAKAHNSGECLAAIDPTGNVHSASFFVWDNQTTSALVLGNNSALRTSGAASLLHWHMIQSAAGKSSTYDFCGSVVESIERFIRSFGGTRIPYFQITRFPKLLKAYLSYIGKV